MISYLYLACLLVSIGSLVFLSQKKYKNTDKYLWTLLLLIPVVILGYWIKSTVHTPEAAMVSFCFIYLDSTFLLVVLIFSIMKSMGKEAGPWVKLSAYGITALHLFSIWISRNTKLYYDSITVEETGLGSVTKMVSGPLKFTHYIFLGAILVAAILVLVIGFLTIGNGSKRNLIVYSSVAVLGISIYTLEMALDASFSALPVMYALGSLIITVNYEHIQSHEIYNLIGEKQSETGSRGFCAFDLRRRLLGYNRQFSEMMPDIMKVIIDERIPKELEVLSQILNKAIDCFDEQGMCAEKIEMEGSTFQLIVSDFSVSKESKPNGYLIELSDITDEQKKLDTAEKYNERLSEEVALKTEHILEIQNAVVLGLANMVENRDNNTGGHVKRTSDVIKFLVEEIQKQKLYEIDDVTAKDIIRAAPMHDLGKISIDSDILCKPERLSDKEYAIMKTHAVKSGEIVNIILEGVEEQHFVDIAFNVARHHHERWDGKGYPDGLMGEKIPLEARIMAEAAVYDALVSKRCYKDALSFDEAAKIMNECMGSQFDPSMRPVFVACRERLEQYYGNSN